MILNKAQYVIYVMAFLGLIVAGWLLLRVNSYGLNNVFSREYRFHDERPLTEDIAVELTRRCLDRAGCDTSRMTPVEYRSDYPTDSVERVLARNSLNPNNGYVLWGPRSDRHPHVGGVWTFLVSIEKRGSEYRCRAVRGK
jgi:hypothetical protein